MEMIPSWCCRKITPQQIRFPSRALTSAATYGLLLTFYGLLSKCSFAEGTSDYERMFNPGYKSSYQSESSDNAINSHFNPPQFETSTFTNVTAARGTTAFVPCKIREQGAHVISWMRYNKQLNIISVGTTMFYPDERYSLVGDLPNSDWTLRIANVNHKDAGIYECQIGTAPKLSRNVTLSVIIPQTISARGNRAGSNSDRQQMEYRIAFICLLLVARCFLNL